MQIMEQKKNENVNSCDGNWHKSMLFSVKKRTAFLFTKMSSCSRFFLLFMFFPKTEKLKWFLRMEMYICCCCCEIKDENTIVFNFLFGRRRWTWVKKTCSNGRRERVGKVWCSRQLQKVTANKPVDQTCSHRGIRGQCVTKFFLCLHVLLCPEKFLLNI